ncbi:hypothetical protein DL89DRAFT_106018 [Linderina pennispora]|uniref:Uncharacterized protein n=1 Tax=Linderina pennispora TaxID=61395 RepID=A0A1Y1WES0_9FUNG|nr:uncharacterized protein DL89DRAFT_106018 [Linderina pennispora]ORX72031.1 hypothetical protein DL89DRAFT_106018 [Linderina pennispora]
MYASSLGTSTHPYTCNISQFTAISAGQHGYTQGGGNIPDNSIVHGSNYLCGTKSTESRGNPLELAACLPATQFKAPLKKYDIAFITNDSTDMPMNAANAYSNPAEWNTRDALAKAGLFVDQRTGLLICHTCKRAVINREFMKHYGQCVLKHASVRRTVSADFGRTLEKYHLHASQHRVHNYTTAREWLESCKGQPIPRIPALASLDCAQVHNMWVRL